MALWRGHRRTASHVLLGNHLADLVISEVAALEAVLLAECLDVCLGWRGLVDRFIETGLHPFIAGALLEQPELGAFCAGFHLQISLELEQVLKLAEPLVNGAHQPQARLPRQEGVRDRHLGFADAADAHSPPCGLQPVHAGRVHRFGERQDPRCYLQLVAKQAHVLRIGCGQRPVAAFLKWRVEDGADLGYLLLIGQQPPAVGVRVTAVHAAALQEGSAHVCFERRPGVVLGVGERLARDLYRVHEGATAHAGAHWGEHDPVDQRLLYRPEEGHAHVAHQVGFHLRVQVAQLAVLHQGIAQPHVRVVPVLIERALGIEVVDLDDVDDIVEHQLTAGAIVDCLDHPAYQAVPVDVADRQANGISQPLLVIAQVKPQR